MNLIRKFRLRLATQAALRSARNHTRERMNTLRPKRLLVMCYGNIYRSPLVEAYLRRRLAGLPDLELRSAGFHPKGGRTSQKEFIDYVCQRAGLDLSSHRSRVVTASDLAWADGVLIMDRHNWHALAASRDVHDVLAKVLWLGAFGKGDSVEIRDPYGLPRDEMIAIVDTLLKSCDGVVRSFGKDPVPAGSRDVA